MKDQTLFEAICIACKVIDIYSDQFRKTLDLYKHPYEKSGKYLGQASDLDLIRISKFLFDATTRLNRSLSALEPLNPSGVWVARVHEGAENILYLEAFEVDLYQKPRGSLGKFRVRYFGDGMQIGDVEGGP